MPNAVVDISRMKVGGKGGGKHWTKKEVESRAAAAASLKPKTVRRPKPPARLKPPADADDEVKKQFKRISSAIRKVWNKTVDALDEHGLLEAADEDILAKYCVAVVREDECNRLIEEHGYVSLSITGGETVSPYVKAQQTYSRMVLQYAEKLGLTPAARARIAKRLADGTQEKEDKNAELFA